MHRPARPVRRTRAAVAALLTAGLLATGCGGTSSEEGKTDTTGGGQTREDLGLTVDAGESGLAEAGEPQRGGTLVYGLEAESPAGYCLSEAQLAISGMVVVRAFYDTLTVPNAEGGFSPYLARSVTPNADYTEWTIALREGVTFHDGSALDAIVVKNNLDAYRGAYPGRPSLLFSFILQDIADTRVDDPLTVTVTTKRPWVSFPAFLFSSSRMGIMAQAQLDAPAESCADHPIGTGPFRFVSWTRNQKLVGERNEDYWQIAPDGEPYPYVDGIELRPMPDGNVRANAVEAGDVNIIHNAEGDKIKNTFRELRDAGKVNLLVSDEQAEVAFTQLNTGAPPFDDVRMRKAAAHAIDRVEGIRRLSAGLPQPASGPFGPGSIGQLDDAGFPAYDPAAAKSLLAEYRADTGNDGSFTIMSSTDPFAVRSAERLQQEMREIGVEVTIETVDQVRLIDGAIAGTFQAMTFRNYPGGDPDQNYVWWYGDGNPVNFGRWDNPELNDLLDAGRQEPDPAERQRIYQDVNRIMAGEVYGLWSSWVVWAVVTAPTVHNIFGPPLPGDDPSQPGDATTDDPARQPGRGLATTHSLIGLWIEQ